MDFSNVGSRQDADRLVKDGVLVPMLLFPSEFGGEYVCDNVVFVPDWVNQLKSQNTTTLVQMIQSGSVDQLRITPEYKGDSFIPTKIHINAKHSRRPGEMNYSIDVW